MQDIYEILSRHFSNESIDADQSAIETFKKNHELEYQMLEQLWHQQEIKVKDFDSGKAWQSMKLSTGKPLKTKTIKLTPVFLRLAAAVMIFFMGAVAIYYYQIYLPSHISKTVQIINKDRGKNITLIDGTNVWLNKNAIISYPKSFSGKARNVALRGEAFFQVKKNQKQPFIIQTTHSSIEVVGTSFNVRVSEDITLVNVEKGQVKVSTKISRDQAVIEAGYSAKTEKGHLTRFKTKNPNFLSWKTGNFKFNNTPLQQVIEDLNTYYTKTIIIDRKKPVECNLTAQFNQTSLQDILNIIKLTCKCEIKETAVGYSIYAKSLKK